MRTVLPSSGIEIGLRFKYGVDKRKRRTTTIDITKRAEMPGDWTLAVQSATLKQDLAPQVIYSATVPAPRKDQFVKDVGRTEALKELFRKYRLPEADWKAILLAYNNRKQPPRPALKAIVYGSPAIGKSHIVREMAELKDLPVTEIPMYDPFDTAKQQAKGQQSAD